MNRGLGGPVGAAVEKNTEPVIQLTEKAMGRTYIVLIDKPKAPERGTQQTRDTNRQEYKMTRTFVLMATAAAVAFSGIAFSTGDAEAKRRGGSTYQQWEFDTAQPSRGYEGFSGGGLGRYCSYRREPERKCHYSGGYEKCKIVSWRLIQKCY